MAIMPTRTKFGIRVRCHMTVKSESCITIIHRMQKSVDHELVLDHNLALHHPLDQNRDHDHGQDPVQDGKIIGPNLDIHI